MSVSGEIPDGELPIGAASAAPLLNALKLSGQLDAFVARAEKTCTKLTTKETFLPFVYDFEEFCASPSVAMVIDVNREFGEKVKRQCLLALLPNNVRSLYQLRIRNAELTGSDEALETVSTRALLAELPTVMRITALQLNQTLMKPTRSVNDSVDGWFLRQARYHELCVAASATIPESDHIRACIACWPTSYQVGLDMATVNSAGDRNETWAAFLATLMSSNQIRASLEGAEYRAAANAAKFDVPTKPAGGGGSSGSGTERREQQVRGGFGGQRRGGNNERGRGNARGGFVKPSGSGRGSGTATPDRATTLRTGACHICGEMGHWAPACPQRGIKTDGRPRGGGARRVATTSGGGQGTGEVARSSGSGIGALSALLGGYTPGGNALRVRCTMTPDPTDMPTTIPKHVHDDDDNDDLFDDDDDGLFDFGQDDDCAAEAADTCNDGDGTVEDNAVADVESGTIARVEKIDGHHDQPGNYVAIEILDGRGAYHAVTAIVDTGADMSCIGMVIVKRLGLATVQLTREEYPIMYSFEKRVDCGCACEVTFRMAGATADFTTRMVVIVKDEVLLGAPFFTHVTGLTPATMIANLAVNPAANVGLPGGLLGGAWPPYAPPGMGPRGQGGFGPRVFGLPGHAGTIWGTGLVPGTTARANVPTTAATIIPTSATTGPAPPAPPMSGPSGPPASGPGPSGPPPSLPAASAAPAPTMPTPAAPSAPPTTTVPASTAAPIVRFRGAAIPARPFGPLRRRTPGARRSGIEADSTETSERTSSSQRRSRSTPERRPRRRLVRGMDEDANGDADADNDAEFSDVRRVDDDADAAAIDATLFSDTERPYPSWPSHERPARDRRGRRPEQPPRTPFDIDVEGVLDQPPSMDAEIEFLSVLGREYDMVGSAIAADVLEDVETGDYVYGTRQYVSATPFINERFPVPDSWSYGDSTHPIIQRTWLHLVDWTEPVVDARPGDVHRGRLLVGLDSSNNVVFDLQNGAFGPGAGEELDALPEEGWFLVGLAWSGRLVCHRYDDPALLRAASSPALSSVPSGPRSRVPPLRPTVPTPQLALPAPPLRPALRSPPVLASPASPVSARSGRSMRSAQSTAQSPILSPTTTTTSAEILNPPPRLPDEILEVPEMDVEHVRDAMLQAARRLMPTASRRELSQTVNSELHSLQEGAHTSALLRQISESRLPVLPATSRTVVPSTTPAALEEESNMLMLLTRQQWNEAYGIDPQSGMLISGDDQRPTTATPPATVLSPATAAIAPSRLPRPATSTARTARRQAMRTPSSTGRSSAPTPTTVRPTREVRPPSRFGFSPKEGNIRRTAATKMELSDIERKTAQFTNITMMGQAAPCVANIEALPDPVTKAAAIIPTNLPDDVKQLWKSLPADLFPSEGRHPVANLLPVSFAVNPRYGEHHMPPAWRQSSEFKERQVQQHLDEYERLGIVRKVARTFVRVLHPTFLVPRKGSTLMRLIVDFKSFNACVAPFTYPLPIVDDLLCIAANSSFITEIDLKLAYFSIPISEDSQAFACIENGGQVYALCRLPMGLGPAPAMFQRIVEAICYGTTADQRPLPSQKGGTPPTTTADENFASAESFGRVFKTPLTTPPLTTDVVTLFFDNVIVHTSGSRAEHIKIVKCVLQRICEAGFIVSPSKCHVAKQSTSLLGFLVGHGRRLPSPAIVATFSELTTPPTTVKQCVAAIAALNFLQALTPKFAHIVEPFRQVLCEQRNEKLLSLTPKQRDEWREMVNKVLTCAGTYALKRGSPLRVTTDWSGEAIAAVLEQYDVGMQQWQVVACFAKRCTGAQKTYGSAKGELYAIACALKKWRRLLEGRTFVVRTDSQALLSLGKATATSSFAVRLVDSFVGLDFVIEHLPGVANKMADYLSRQREEFDEKPRLTLDGSKMAVLDASTAEKHEVEPSLVMRPIVRDNKAVEFVLCRCERARWMVSGGTNIYAVV